MRGYREKEASTKKAKKGIIKKIIAELEEEEEGMAHVLEKLNNVEIKMRPFWDDRKGAINLLYSK